MTQKKQSKRYKTLTRLVEIRAELEEVEAELYAEGEREVVNLVQAAKRELSQPTLDTAVIAEEA